MILTEPVTVDLYSNRTRLVAHCLDPAMTLSVNAAAEHLFGYLMSIFTRYLTLGEAVHKDAWERHEYLRLVSQEDQ